MRVRLGNVLNKLKPVTKKRRIVLAVMVLLILVVGGIFYSLFLSGKHVDESAVATQTEDAMVAGNYQSAKDIALDAYNNETDKLKKADYAKQVGLAYLSQNDFTNAKEWYQKALDRYGQVKDQSKVDSDNKQFIENELEYIKNAENYKETKPRNGPENAL